MNAKEKVEQLRNDLHRQIKTVASHILPLFEDQWILNIQGVKRVDCMVTVSSNGYTVEYNGILEPFTSVPKVMERLCNLYEAKTMEVTEFLVGGDSKGFFSTYEKAVDWKNKYTTEWPMARQFGWEIRTNVRVSTDSEVDLPMNWKRGRD